MKTEVSRLFVAALCAVSGVAWAGGELKTVDTAVWEEIVPGVAFGAVFGDWRAEAHGKFVSFQPGVVSPLHTHSGGFHAVVVSGTVINPYPEEANPPEMGPGTYWSTHAGTVHATGCVSEEPCLIYTHMDQGWDISVVEEETP